jgi:predicted RNase H-like HicB family nuclease
MKKPAHLTYVTWKEGKYYVAQCLNVDVSSFGKTKKEAQKNIEQAVGLYLEDEPTFVRIQFPSIAESSISYA